MLRNHLGLGADAATSIGTLAERFGVSHRTMEKRLEALAKEEGIPIVANNEEPKGVYVAQTPAEARAYAESLRGRIAAVQSRITALERWADSQEAPMTLWEAA